MAENTTKRSAMFMQSDADRVVEYAQTKASAFATPSDFWTLLASEVASAKRAAEDAENRTEGGAA